MSETTQEKKEIPRGTPPAMLMPGVEFEGPMGMFWPMDEVPIEALARGIGEIWEECRRRGYTDEAIIELVQKESRKEGKKGGGER